MKYIAALVLLSFSFAHAANMKFSFENTELTEVIKVYSKATGQKFVIDPSVRGKATILLKREVPSEEAFSLLSSALSINGYAISEQGDTMIVQATRLIARSNIPVVRTLPPEAPAKYINFVYTTKHLKADDISKQLRNLTSRDGELSVLSPNELIFSDWVSNLRRVEKLLTELDRPETESK